MEDLEDIFVKFTGHNYLPKGLPHRKRAVKVDTSKFQPTLRYLKIYPKGRRQV